MSEPMAHPVDNAKSHSQESSQSIEPYPTALRAWSAVATLFLLYTVSLLDRNLMSLMMDDIKSDIGASEMQMGLLYGAAFAIFYAIGGLPFGWLMDRYPRRLIIWAGVTLWSLGTIACGLSRNFSTFFVSRSFVGSGEAVLIPGSNSMLPDLFPPSKLALPFSVYGLGSKVGSGASLALGGALTALITPTLTFQLPVIGDTKGWQLVFIVAGVPGILLALLIFLIREPARRSTFNEGANASTFRDYFRFLRRNLGFIVPHHCGTFLLLSALMAISAWAPAYFQRVHLWSSQLTGYWLGIAFAVGSVVSLPLHGLIVDRLFARGVTDAHMRYASLCVFIAAPLAINAFLVSNAWLALVLLGAFMTVISMYVSIPGTALQVVITGDLRGKAASIQLIAVGTLSLTGGPIAVAVLTDRVFSDPAKVGVSVAICVALFLPLAGLLFRLACKPMREMSTGRPHPADPALSRT